MPKATPAAAAIRMAAISSALPGAERKRVSVKAPPKATPAPMLPFTKVSTVPTTKGSTELTIKKRRLARTRKDIIQENSTPESRDASAMIKNCPGVTRAE